MGCGTVPYVAKKLGRNYIGCEINKQYFDVAKQRVEVGGLNE
jgi:DNA modification methylase